MSGITMAVGCSFCMALAAPWVVRYARGRAGVLLSMVPLGLFVYFAVLLYQGGGEGWSAGVWWSRELGVRFGFYVDGLGLLFGLLITGIGALVFAYSGSYLGTHRHAGRFYAYLLGFMGSMLGLVLADDLILLFVFWELTSVTSWLLIGFEHEEEKAREAAWQALLVTSAGGLAWLAGAILMESATGTFAVSKLLERGDLVRADGKYPVIVLLVLFGAFSKSAQFPFHFWLPNAMTAPTPVSAYLHSATMVKAGVFLMARLSPVLGGTQTWEYLLVGFGGATMVGGAFLAWFTTNIKRVLAYLTVSALGMMTVLLGVGSAEAVKACLVFLVAHALYKAALFMVAGSVDHGTGTRDLARLGGLRRAMPLTMAAALLAGVGLAAFGPVLSFVGKEMMLKAVLDWKVAPALVAASVTLTAAVFVAGAGMCAVKPFFGAVRTPAQHEAGFWMWSAPLLLGLLGVLFGVWPSWPGGAIIEPAVSAVLAREVPVHLKLWHGLGPAFWLSLAAVAAGLMLYPMWRLAIGGSARRGEALGFGPERWYDLGLRVLNRVATVQTRILQHGYLRLYILTILAAATALTGSVLWSQPPVAWFSGSIGLPFWEVSIAGLILLAVGAMIWLEARLAVVAALSVAGYGMALLFVVFSAPDLAMTQFLIETLVLVLLIMAFYRLPKFKTISRAAVRWRDLGISLAFGAVITSLLLGVNAAGPTREVAEYYAEHSVSEARAHNMVNAILVDFRALDTMGEITVLVTAAVGVLALLHLARKGGAK